MAYELSQRGFKQYEPFTDMYGNTIRVVESSNVRGGVWVFCNNEQNPDPSPHMNRAQTLMLIERLQEALANQSFEDDDAAAGLEMWPEMWESQARDLERANYKHPEAIDGLRAKAAEFRAAAAALRGEG